MTALNWDQVSERPWVNGLDRGVLYCASGEAVPWNGLIKYSEKTSIKVDSAYFDGYKIHDTTDFATGCEGEVEAITYPDLLDDPNEFAPGATMSQQGIRPFNFSCRQKLSDGGYNIHVFGNMTFVPKTLGYETISDSSEALTFKFNASAPRILVSGMPPASHFSVNTNEAEPKFLAWLEERLYGTDSVAPSMPSFRTFMEELRDFVIIGITNNGDGSWTASSNYAGYIFDLGNNEFQIDNADVTIIDADTYEIGDT